MGAPTKCSRTLSARAGWFRLTSAAHSSMMTSSMSDLKAGCAMATRMSIRCVVGSVLTIAGLGACAQAQYLYAGPGTVVQGQVNGTFFYNSYGYPYLAPGSYLAPPVLVPVPNPYLYAPPAVLPPPYRYAPNFYRPRLPLPQVPYGAYPPRPNRPTAAGPTPSPGPSPQVIGRKPPTDQKPPSTALPQRSAPQRPDRPSAPQPPTTPTTSGQVPQRSSMVSKAPTSRDPNKPAENPPR
jgi:hypothetical protein